MQSKKIIAFCVALVLVFQQYNLIGVLLVALLASSYNGLVWAIASLTDSFQFFRP